MATPNDKKRLADEMDEDDRSFRQAARDIEIQQRGGRYHDRILLPNSMDSAKAGRRALGRPGSMPVKRA